MEIDQLPFSEGVWGEWRRGVGGRCGYIVCFGRELKSLKKFSNSERIMDIHNDWIIINLGGP